MNGLSFTVIQWALLIIILILLSLSSNIFDAFLIRESLCVIAITIIFFSLANFSSVFLIKS